ncbi:hypothetical protein V1264_015140 [Littorina saxatilis]|uniref:Uncharacterized protein n=1 Tax=Littorina saxatilis TaxID=31220 RepID=A0AAN9GHQ2_9CAEN
MELYLYQLNNRVLPDENWMLSETYSIYVSDVMKDYVAAADETDSDKERCLKNLKSLFSAVACGECGGTLSVCFGDKMGYSREIRLACEDCTFTKQQHSCS